MNKMLLLVCVLGINTAMAQTAPLPNEMAEQTLSPTANQTAGQTPSPPTFSPEQSSTQLDDILTSDTYSNKSIRSEWVLKEPKETKERDLSWLGRLLETLAEWGEALSGVVGVFGKTVALIGLALFAYWLYRTRETWLSWLGKLNYGKANPTAKIALSHKSVRPWDKDLPPKHELMAFLSELLYRHQWLMALSVLYQATLRELGTQHRLPIDKHQTEDECLWLLQRCQDAGDKEQRYFKELVGLWRASAYGKRLPVGVSNQDYSQIRALMQAWQLLYLKGNDGGRG